MSGTDLRHCADVDDLLRTFVRRGFTRQVAGPLHDPYVIILYRDWGTHADLAHVRSRDRVDAARVSTVFGVDVYGPGSVVWHYFGDAVRALTALRDLPPPHASDAPRIAYPPPRELPRPVLATLRDTEPREALRVAPEERRTLTIRIPEHPVPR